MLFVQSEMEAPDRMNCDIIGLIRDLRELGVLEEVAQRAAVGPKELAAWEGGEQPGANFAEFVSACAQTKFTSVLAAHGFQPPSYDVTKDYSYNFVHGPVGAFSSTALTGALYDLPRKLCGFPVNFPFGIPACALTANSRWVGFYAHKGFDVLTFKTLRSKERDAHPWPNWAFIPDVQSLSHEDVKTQRRLRGALGHSFVPEDPYSITTANSFGIPSRSPDDWSLEIKRAKDYLVDGQVLIVSVVGDEQSPTEENLIADFVEVAVRARDAGAQIIEANLSCPNTQAARSVGGETYRDARLAGEIAKAVKAAIKETPLLLKIGYADVEHLSRLVAATSDYADGYVAINTIAMRIVDASGAPIFPPTGDGRSRELAGVSGTAIKPRALEVVRNLTGIREETQKSFAVIGVGGVMNPSDVFAFLHAGADAVQSCTGAWFNADLAIETRRSAGVSDSALTSIRHSAAEQAEQERRKLVREKILLALFFGGPQHPDKLLEVVELDLIPSAAEIGLKLGGILESLRDDCMVEADTEGQFRLTPKAKDSLKRLRAIAPAGPQQLADVTRG